MRCAELKPEFPVSIFPQRLRNQHHGASSITRSEVIRLNDEQRRSKDLFSAKSTQNDDFADDEIDDQDLIAAGKCLL